LSGGQRAVLVIVTVVIAVGAFLVLRPEDEDSEPVTRTTTPTETTTTAPEQTQPERTAPEEPEMQTIRVREGEPVGGLAEIEAKQGETVRFQVSADAEHEVHLHGYDVFEGVTADRPARFELEATETGIFEIELEDTHTQIAELKVER
jgi:plastocyanin